MRSKILVLSILFVLAVSSSAWPADFSEGEALAVFRVPEGVSVSAAEVSVAGAEVAETFETLSEIEGKVFVLVRSGTKTTEQLIAELKARPDVIAASPNYYTHRQAVSESAFPNDPSADLCWGLKAIRAPEVWEHTTGSRDIYVCVVDTGIYRHPDLEANLADSLGLNTQTVREQYDLTFGSWDADLAGHGTQLAGIIGAVGNNGLGVAGVNWNVSIIPVRVFDISGAYETISYEIRSLNYIANLLQKNPNLKLAALNLSIGAELPITPQEMQQDVYWMAYHALDSLNRTLIVACAGNLGLDTSVAAPFDDPTGTDRFVKGAYFYPASFIGLNNLIVVGAIASDDTAATTTNWGASVDIAAPGVDILSTYSPLADVENSPMYKSASGTSVATPHVTGAAALLMSAFPNATPAQIKAALLDGANRDKNPLVYPYAYTVKEIVADGLVLLDRLIDLGVVSELSRDAMIENVTSEAERVYAPYKALDGTGRVSRTGFLDVKAAYDLLAQRVKVNTSGVGSSSGGCNAGYSVMVVLAAISLFCLGKKIRL